MVNLLIVHFAHFSRFSVVDRAAIVKTISSVKPETWHLCAPFFRGAQSIL